MAKMDEITNQLMWNRLLSVVEEQGQTLVRTAFSPIVRECGDISAGIFDKSNLLSLWTILSNNDSISCENNLLILL